MREKRMLLWGLLCCALAGYAGCGGTGDAAATSPAPTTAAATTAANGEKRIVSTVPAATLNLVQIGATDRLVGVSKYDTIFLPPEKAGLPVVGDYETMNPELLLELKPTAVVVQTAEARLSERLRGLAAEHHFELVNIRLDTVDDLWGTVKTLGRISGREDAAAMAILHAQEELKRIAAENKDRPKVKVVYVIGRDPTSVAGGKTFLNEMVTLAGGENAAAAVGDLYPVIGNEMLAKLAPDVLLVSAADEPAQQKNDPRLEPFLRLPVPAAKSGRVFLVTNGESLTASVRIAEHVRELSELIHKDPKAGATESGREGP